LIALVKKSITVLLFGFFLGNYSSYSQEILIEGVLKDSQETVAFATIILSLDKSENNVVAYTNSDDKGFFQLEIKNKIESDSLWLTVRDLNHATKQLKLSAVSQVLDIELAVKENQLREVIIKAKRDIRVNGDTITYSVDGLKKEKDYTIEEVITRIPGVQISENGQIKYKDKAISHLYINGVDLLEGGYNVATRGIPADAVQDIEIMQRHNHARIDKGNTESDEVAFNLNIKKDNSLVFGSAKTDLGVPFLTGLVEATPIYVRETFQDIASLKLNNIGKSLASNGTSLTRGNLNLSSLQIPKAQFLNEPNTNGTSISDSYWLDNESLSLTNNTLVKKGDDVIFKVGLAYNKGIEEIQRISNSTYFFGNDSTVVNTRSNNNIEKELFYIGLFQEVNKEKLYFTNKLKFSSENNNGLSNNIQNGESLIYNYNSKNHQFTDLVEFRTTIGKKVLNNGFLIEYVETQENSTTVPGVFNDQIPSSFMAEQTKQIIDTQQFNIGGYTSFNFSVGKSTLEFKQSLDWKSEKLYSNLQQEGGEQNTTLNFPFKSDFKLNTLESQTSAESIYDWGKFKLKLMPQISYLILEKQELLQQDLNQKENYLFFEPQASINYKYNNNWNFSLSSYRSVNASRFAQLFNGLLLRDFSSLYRNPNAINITRNTVGSLKISYDDILSGFFINNVSSYSKNQSDFTFTNIIDENGLIQIEAIERPNTSRNWRNTISFTKRFFRILRTDLEYSINYRIGEQFFNGIEQEFKNTNHNIGLELGLDNNTWYGLTYKANINNGSSIIDDLKNTNLFLKHELELDFYTSSVSRLNLGLESVVTSTSSNSFTNRNTLFNISFFYKPTKKLFFSAVLTNLLNEDFFTVVQNSSNFIGQSQFSLRPRQFTLGLNYSL